MREINLSQGLAAARDLTLDRAVQPDFQNAVVVTVSGKQRVITAQCQPPRCPYVGPLLDEPAVRVKYLESSIEDVDVIVNVHSVARRLLKISSCREMWPAGVERIRQSLKLAAADRFHGESAGEKYSTARHDTLIMLQFESVCCAWPL